MAISLGAQPLRVAPHAPGTWGLKHFPMRIGIKWVNIDIIYLSIYIHIYIYIYTGWWFQLKNISGKDYPIYIYIYLYPFDPNMDTIWYTNGLPIQYLSVYTYIYIYLLVISIWWVTLYISMGYYISICIYIYIYIYWLVVSTPWKILVNGKDYPIYYGKKKMFQTTNQYIYMCVCVWTGLYN